VAKGAELPVDQRQCSCGGELHEIGVEETEELERVEVTVVHKLQRVKKTGPSLSVRRSTKSDCSSRSSVARRTKTSTRTRAWRCVGPRVSRCSRSCEAIRFVPARRSTSMVASR